MNSNPSLRPYRVEWRYSAVSNWILQHEADGHDEALELAADAVRAHGGYARVIVQHVIDRVSK